MRFEQPSPTIDYRRNMVLQALLKIEALYELAHAASPELLANIKEALADPDRLCEMATAIALYYLHREPTESPRVSWRPFRLSQAAMA
ncbi:hypothetical protein [Pseudomonas aeruginosa]|uniref:hypothetical protein n=1 Tax=Pseudomonas aeruginosa TaxID=287 RepID=UPI001D0B1EA6|nr:hypothetical protein [Pseudomonas aeruginosa]MCC0240369.1 hypothetical protein [Pseudomonas aeruginosa]